MTQPQTTAKKTETKTAKASDPKATKATESKMKEFEKAGETVLAKDKRKASAKKTATRKKAPVKKASPKATSASPKAKAHAKPKTAVKTTPDAAAPAPDAPKTRRPRFARGQDPRIPPAGTTLVRPYKGEEIRVTVLEDGFRWKKQDFSSLSACAKAITGTKGTINAVLWFRLTDASGSAESAAS
jgi:hypothetical protein